MSLSPRMFEYDDVRQTLDLYISPVVSVAGCSGTVTLITFIETRYS